MSRYVTPCWTFSGRFSRSLTDTELRSGCPQNLTSVCGSSSKRSSRAFTLAEKSISGFPTPPTMSGASCAPCPVFCCSEGAFPPLNFCTEDGFEARDAESLLGDTKAPPLSLNNYTPIYIYLSWVCNKRRDDSLATESRLGLAQSLPYEKSLSKVLRMQTEDAPLFLGNS